MKTYTATLLATLLASAATAAPIHFDFRDPKGVNNVVFLLDAPLESINGTGNAISGHAVYDPEAVSNLAGTIILDVASLKVPNERMQRHLLGETWMDAEKFPTITFEVVRLADISTEGDTATGQLTGALTVKGITREITVPVRLTYLPGRLRERGGDVDGDLLVVRSTFSIRRDDYGINPGTMNDKVAQEIKITLSIVGLAPKPTGE